MSRINSRSERLWTVPLLALVTVPAVLGISGQAADASGRRAAAAAALDARADASGTFYGPAQAIGNGNVRTYVEVRGGQPVEIGVAFSERALENLPRIHGSLSTNPMDLHANMKSYDLALPEQAARTPFKFVELDWNPGGHEPPGIYDHPHFDFHFYTITPEQRNAIDPEVEPEYQKKTEALPSAGFMPERYVAPAMVAVPRMGLHWIDPTSPELNGQKFTRTFIYGSWNGETIFWEPMITRDFILSRPEFRAEVPQPKKVAVAGFYPDGYSVRFDEGTKEYRIALTNLSWRAQ